MNQQQKTDYQFWKDNPQDPLPESLENVFIDDCFEIIIEKGLSINFGNSLRFEICGWYNDQKFLGFYISNHTDGDDLYLSEVTYERLNDHEKIIVIQTLLSQTPDGKAVMAFLDVEIMAREAMYDFDFYSPKDCGCMAVREFKRMTLDHLLYQEFTEALRIGKTLKQALEAITKTYLLHFYE